MVLVVDIFSLQISLVLCPGALQRMVQNIALSAGSAVGSTCLNLWPNDLLLATRIGWGITLVLVIMSLKDMTFSKHNN